MLYSCCCSPRQPIANPYQPTPENLKARTWFQDARFGLFVHWGVYSTLAAGGWVMNVRKIDKATYQKLPALFYPTGFDAKEWVAMVKAAGMKYITITSKHHDGFAMFDSKQTNWDIMDRTPYKQDPLKMLAEECRQQGIKLFFYHSQLDWYQENYCPRGFTGNDAGRAANGKIQPEFVDTLKVVGQWTAKYGETIYGTRGGPVEAKSWGVSTQKGKQVFLHVLHAEDPNLLLSGCTAKITSVTVFGLGSKLKFKQGAFGTVIEPPKTLDEVDTILVLE